MTSHRPDFLVVGAMKSATTTLHEQLARQPGFFMTRPKEPNFFSDDDIFARGPDWYASLFQWAPPGALRGESSTHYTKRATHPRAAERIAAALPGVKIVYLMRHPVERLLSHYVHEVTNGETTLGIREAVRQLPGLVDYGLYHRQLEPYLDAFGGRNVLPVFFRRLVRSPQQELERICRFLGAPGRPAWDQALSPRNVGSERLRASVLRNAIAQAPILTPIRQRLVPRCLTEPLKSFWRSGAQPPALPDDLAARLRGVFDDDLGRLGDRLGVGLSCDTFREVTQAGPLEWVDRG